MPREHEAGSRLEEEGIPDLQDGTPEQQWSSDPQEAPIPGDAPAAAGAWGTTAAEQSQGESLDARLAQEEPEATGQQAGERDVPANLYRPTDEHAGRLVAPDAGLGADTEPTEVATDVGADSGGFTAEEAAMHVVPEFDYVEPQSEAERASQLDGGAAVARDTGPE